MRPKPSLPPLARLAIAAAVGTAAVAFDDTTVACRGPQGRRGRTTLQAPSRQAGTPLEFMVALVSALGLDVGSSTIQVTSNIALTQADVAGRTLPLRLGPGQTLVIEGGQSLR